MTGAEDVDHAPESEERRGRVLPIAGRSEKLAAYALSGAVLSATIHS